MSNKGRYYYIIISVNRNYYISEVKQTTQALPFCFHSLCEKYFKYTVRMFSDPFHCFHILLCCLDILRKQYISQNEKRKQKYIFCDLKKKINDWWSNILTSNLSVMFGGNQALREGGGSVHHDRAFEDMTVYFLLGALSDCWDNKKVFFVVSVILPSDVLYKYRN